MIILEQSTRSFMEDVMASTTFSVVNSPKRSIPLVDHSTDNTADRIEIFNHGGRRQARRMLRLMAIQPSGGSSKGKVRLLQSTLDEVIISNVEDVPCSDPSLTHPVKESPCQRVTASVKLTHEPENNGMQQDQFHLLVQFQEGISTFLADSGMSFPEDSGIVYAGVQSEPLVETPVLEVPKGSSFTVPAPVPVQGGETSVKSEKEEEDDATTKSWYSVSTMPGYAVPVIIGAVTMVAILVGLFGRGS